ncbi:MAG: DUF4365 domain-containing protein [Phenylobacterium sp.]|uniref:DUF4365 domain-containing protein n=1 Tax=Phenylobacterium sp. TaxID=1871053 RepID=UPI003BB6F787
MPQRPRSHQLEDISLNRFRDLVPPAWVVRERSRDYGLDLEVEVFTEAGDATGLFFYVQVRATDDPNSARKLRFDVDQLDYFRLLDLPTAIVRYCASDDSFHLMWGFEAPLPEGSKATQTLTFEPGQQWTAGTAGQILRTLETLRRLNHRSESAPLALAFLDDQADPDRSYAIQSAMERLGKLGFVTPVHETSPVTLEVHSSEQGLTLRIDRFAEVDVEDPGPDPTDLTTLLGWSAIQLLRRLGLKGAANRLVRSLTAAGFAPPTRPLALAGALALLPDVAAAVDLACQAGLQDNQDEAYFILTAAIHSVGLSPSDVESRLALCREALECHARNGDVTAQAATTYSIGNTLRAADRFAEAVAWYNRALKLRPAYADAAYFWSELGGCFYMRRKFRAAARAYERALALEPDTRLQLLAADALLGGGEPSLAAELFDLASEDPTAGSPGEAWLKGEFCRRLAAERGASFERPIRILGPLWARAGIDGDWDAIIAIDPLDPLANFNEGVALGAGGKNGDAFWRFLAVALMQPGDVEAWSNAVGCALSVGADHTSAALHLALFHCSRAAYDRLRKQLVDQGRRELLPDLDAAVRDILEEATSSSRSTLAIRLFDGERFRHVFNVPSE